MGHKGTFVPERQEWKPPRQAGSRRIRAGVASHGVGTVLKKTIEETADQLAFLSKELGM